MNRRVLLRELIDNRYEGNVAAFARAIKKSPSQIHQWLSGHRTLGDAGARHIERSVPGLWQGYFDGEQKPSWSDSAPNTPNTTTKLSDEEARYREMAWQIDHLPSEIRAVVMISMGRDPDEPLPPELTESIRRMLDSIADLIKQAQNRKK